MNKKQLKITNLAQFERLVTILQENPELARGKGQFGSSKKQQEEQWQNITVELNSIGPPLRTTKEWQRVWIHYKANLKRKLANNKKNVITTGGGPSEHINLTPMEENVAELIELQNTINPKGVAYGVDQPIESCSLQCEGEDENVLPSVSTPHVPSIERAPKRKLPVKAIDEQRLEYLKTQTENQSAILDALKQIEKVNYKNYEINKKKVELQTKMYELKKKKYTEASELHAINVQMKKKKIALIELQLNSMD